MLSGFPFLKSVSPFAFHFLVNGLCLHYLVFVYIVLWNLKGLSPFLKLPVFTFINIIAHNMFNSILKTQYHDFLLWIIVWILWIILWIINKLNKLSLPSTSLPFTLPFNLFGYIIILSSSRSFLNTFKWYSEFYFRWYGKLVIIKTFLVQNS